MTLPNFLVFGALKCGTTSLYSYLKQHPQIYMAPIKESRYFCYDENVPECRNKPLSVFPIRSIEEYEALFDDVAGEKAVGEASPLKIVLQEDLKMNVPSVMQELFHFLEVDESFVPDVSEKKCGRYSQAKIPPSPAETRSAHQATGKALSPCWSDTSRKRG